MQVEQLAPAALWKNFKAINDIPRASKKEERIVAFMMQYGQSLGLETFTDSIGNVIIRKPATAGMGNRTPVVLQSHLDMVHQKNADTAFDFANQGIEMYIDGDWVRARGTTLGADNGIGVASIMAILGSKDIPHPPLEALFTIDEETGMTGALGLEGGILQGKILLNLDTEDDSEITIGCAGGVDVTAIGSYSEEHIPTGMSCYELVIKGLTGGHSGMEIHLGRGNANKLLNRVLLALQKTGIRLLSIEGGGLRNAIPREAKATIAASEKGLEAIHNEINRLREELIAEYHSTDPNLELSIQKTEAAGLCCSEDFQNTFFSVVGGIHNGIYRMSPDIPGLVQTSNNLARVVLQNGSFSIQCLTRSSVDSEKMDLAENIAAVCHFLGGKVTFSGAYPGWTPNPEAAILHTMVDLYKKRFQSEPHVNACHAGLECGILGRNYPDMEMISFGPTIRGAHSPAECVQISSVHKYWGYLLETLQCIPDNKS